MATGGTLTLRKAEDEKLREHCEHRFKSMMPTSDQTAEWYEIAGYCMPSRSRQLVEACKGKNRDASRKVTILDDYAINSFETCANGMLTGLSSRSRPWRKSILEDDGLMDVPGVRVWLEQYDRLLDSSLAASNFYEAMLSCYHEMAGFGVAAVVFMENRAASPKLVSHALTAGEYGIAVGEDLRPNALARTYTLTARNIVSSYVADRFDSQVLDWERVPRAVKEAWDAGNYEAPFVVKQVIEPNPAYIPGRLGKIGMPYRAMRWLERDDQRKRFLAIEGYRSQPFAAPRWQTMAGEVWGTGRGKMALPSMRDLQLQSKRKGQVTDMVAKPATWGPPALGRVSMNPGAHTTVATTDRGAGIAPVYTMPYQAIGEIREDLLEVRRSVDRMTYADVFMAITRMDGVQPRNVEELVRRHEEQLTQLGPVTDRANFELLQVASDRVGDILATRGDLLNALPPPPEDLEGEEIATDFVSVLAQAQRMLGIGQTERAVSMVGNMVAAFPEVRDNIDPDAIVRDYWDRSGATPSGLRDPAQRDAIRQQRAAAAQQQQIAAMMAPVKDGADAARLLSETDVGGGSALDALVGG